MDCGQLDAAWSRKRNVKPSYGRMRNVIQFESVPGVVGESSAPWAPFSSFETRRGSSSPNDFSLCVLEFDTDATVKG